MQLSVQLEHVSVGCNRVVGALDWGLTGLVAYGGHNAVVIYDAEEAAIKATLLGHTGRANCVKWFPGTGDCPILASGAADGTVIIWLWQPGDSACPWRIAARLSGAGGSVSGLAVQAQPSGGWLLASAAGDQLVHLWQASPPAGGSSSSSVAASVEQAAWRLAQQVAVGFQLAHCCALTHPPGLPAWSLLALGGVDASVRLLLRPPGGQFEQVCRLTGHTDWVRSLAFAHTGSTDAPGRLLLASASQDKYIRIWAVQPDNAQGSSKAPSTSDTDGLSQQLARYAPQPQLVAGMATFTATLEALLIGHEDWVHSVSWQPPVAAAEASLQQPLCLLSASMDRTMALSRPDPATGLWLSQASLGDAGSSSFGYFGAAWAPDGTAVIAHGFTGALHLWRLQDDAWQPAHALGGHVKPVADMCWGVDGGCLLTASADQTVRITTQCQGHWCEIARPQVHGHDFSSIAYLPSPPGQSGQHVYASGSEEKVIRVFEAPLAFAETLAAARGGGGLATDVLDPASAAGEANPAGNKMRALGASVAALGLSNRAVYADDDQIQIRPGDDSGLPGYTDGPDCAPNPTPSAVTGPPLEEHLAQNTLWPEICKLYGHGNNLVTLAAHPSGTLLASASNAQSAASAGIRLWDTRTWAEAGTPLAAHTLTVTALEFSPCGQYLLSGSRDRTFAVFGRTPDDSGAPAGEDGSAANRAVHCAYRLLCRVAKAHTRIIWGVSWAPDSRLLATGSRDGTVKLWSMAAAGPHTTPVAMLPPFQTAVTAVSFAPSAPASDSSGTAASGDSCRWLAVGLEDGRLEVWRVSVQGQSGQSLNVQCGPAWHAPVSQQHGAAVQKLCWQTTCPAGAEQTEPRQHAVWLATCGDDHAVRIYKVTLPN